jgi:methionyl-tRNA formyltransferase
MRIALFGQAGFGKDTLDALLKAGEQVVGVSTPRAGARPDPLRVAADEHSLPILETPDLRRQGPLDAFRAWQPGLLVFAFVTDIVRQPVLDAATHGAIQYHPSLLPRHRGRSAMNWPIIAGETRTGLTVFWVDEGIDTGPILLQREVDIAPDDTLGSLYFPRLYPMGIEALVEAVAMVREGRAPRIPQDESLATYEEPCEAAHARIDFTRPARVVYNHIRGCDPAPGAYASLGGEPLRLFDTSLVEGKSDAPAGTVTAVAEGRAEVALIGGTLRIGRVQREGGAKVAAAEVLDEGDALANGM